MSINKEILEKWFEDGIILENKESLNIGDDSLSFDNLVAITTKQEIWELWCILEKKRRFNYQETPSKCLLVIDTNRNKKEKITKKVEKEIQETHEYVVGVSFKVFRRLYKEKIKI